MAENRKAIGTIKLKSGEIATVYSEDERFYFCEECKFRKSKYVLEPVVEKSEEEDNGKNKKKKKKADEKNADGLPEQKGDQS